MRVLRSKAKLRLLDYEWNFRQRRYVTFIRRIELIDVPLLLVTEHELTGVKVNQSHNQKYTLLTHLHMDTTLGHEPSEATPGPILADGTNLQRLG